jgi:hypothetical protein
MAGIETALARSANTQIRRIAELVLECHAERATRAHATSTPANLDCLVNKLRRRVIRTLFIKLELILRQQRPTLVNRSCAWAISTRERRIKWRAVMAKGRAIPQSDGGLSRRGV